MLPARLLGADWRAAPERERAAPPGHRQPCSGAALPRIDISAISLQTCWPRRGRLNLRPQPCAGIKALPAACSHLHLGCVRCKQAMTEATQSIVRGQEPQCLQQQFQRDYTAASRRGTSAVALRGQAGGRVERWPGQGSEPWSSPGQRVNPGPEVKFWSLTSVFSSVLPPQPALTTRLAELKYTCSGSLYSSSRGRWTRDLMGEYQERADMMDSLLGDEVGRGRMRGGLTSTVS